MSAQNELAIVHLKGAFREKKTEDAVVRAQLLLLLGAIKTTPVRQSCDLRQRQQLPDVRPADDVQQPSPSIIPPARQWRGGGCFVLAPWNQVFCACVRACVRVRAQLRNRRPIKRPLVGSGRADMRRGFFFSTGHNRGKILLAPSCKQSSVASKRCCGLVFCGWNLVFVLFSPSLSLINHSKLIFWFPPTPLPPCMGREQPLLPPFSLHGYIPKLHCTVGLRVAYVANIIHHFCRWRTLRDHGRKWTRPTLSGEYGLCTLHAAVTLNRRRSFTFTLY